MVSTPLYMSLHTCKDQELQIVCRSLLSALSGGGNSCDIALASVHQLLMKEPTWKC